MESASARGGRGPGDRWRPRPAFVAALAAALLAWWWTEEPAHPPTLAVVEAAPSGPVAPPAIVDTLQPDQTLSEVWSDHGLEPAVLAQVVEAGAPLFPFRKLRPGTEVRLQQAPGGALRRVDLGIDRDRQLVMRRNGPGFEAELVETPFVRKPRQVSACIDGSPWQALADAGEDPVITVRMARVLAAQIDFYTDIQPGDCFDLAFTVDERPDATYRVATLDAIRFRLGNVVHEAYRFDGEEDERESWYDAEGRPLARRFLRSPLQYTRISSGFGMRRHPILRRVRPHNGVDYVAPVGTPVQASGDGVVTFAGRNGGYGLLVRLKHGKRYVTSYAHLSRIAPGIRPGTRVSQGRVIGYVGSTGLSTGPHLDYRFMVDGRYVDPRSAVLPAADPLDPSRMPAFEWTRDALIARLEATEGLEVPFGIPSSPVEDVKNAR